MTSYTQQLAGFLVGLRCQDPLPAVLTRIGELLLGWLDSALAGKGQHSIPSFECHAERMSSTGGNAQILPSRRCSLPYFAALMSSAASHVIKQDDLHNSSMLHPAAMILPAALTATQDLDRSSTELILTVVTDYEVDVHIGEFFSRSHYRVFHTTAMVDTFTAVVAVGKLIGFDRERFVDLLGSAGTQTAGLWEFLRDIADSKQLHIVEAAADGLLVAYLTADSLSDVQHILEGEQGMTAGMPSDVDPECLVDRLGGRWALLETSFKFHASCRHTRPAADTLLALIQREGLNRSQIAVVTAQAYQGAIDVLGRMAEPQTAHQAKFSMGTVLGLIAVYDKVGLGRFHRHVLSDPRVATLRERVEMCLNPEIDAAYPQHWLGRVEAPDGEGRRHTVAIDEPRGDPGNTLSRNELADRFHRLLAFSGTVTDAGAEILIQRTQGLHRASSVTPLI